VNFFTKIWYGKTLSCRTSLKSGTAAAVPVTGGAAHAFHTKGIGTYFGLTENGGPENGGPK